MKNKVLITFFSTIIISCSQNTNEFDLKYENGIWYKDKKPYSGDVYKVFKNKKINLGKIIDGKKDGKWTEFGRLIYRTGQYDSGKRSGEWKGWYEDSSKAYSGFYKYDLKVGEWRGWNKNGNISYVGTYKEGKKDSTWCFWFENGKISDSGKYDQGKMIGTWKYFDDQGNLKKEKFFD